ncbi:Uncharacterised protein [Mycobacteroides abscessus]|nr:Uncharacterised protein [Mycobacteroides abscessus]SKK94644.1 Uncharacterised protein [Mycobacteroides abscessus subsp. massiliense]CPU62994.1 Uncharacterised protein [Mycobacteroides abscessus]CPU64125.1 Uncharacterised protein [Mycobacteroides abscessus]SKQ39362.1 Uncharacterised protein [Mycobacteroides abscessus subsp. massiliense]
MADDLVDGESVGPRQHAGVHRIVLEDEQSVEQSFLPGNTMNLTQRNMLMLQRFSVLPGELIQEIRSGGGRADIGAHRHGIDQQANHRFGTRYIRGAAGDHRTKDHVLLSGQRGEQQCPRPLQHRVDRGVLRTRQFAQRSSETPGQLMRAHPPPPQPRLLRWANESGSLKSCQHLTPGRLCGCHIACCQPADKVPERGGGG